MALKIWGSVERDSNIERDYGGPKGQAAEI